MPRTKRFKLTPEQTRLVRQAIETWMGHQGHTDVSLAALLQVKVETVKVNLGRADYKTQRPISDEFLSRIQRASGLQLVDEAGLAPQTPPPPPVPAASEQALFFMARAMIATAGQLALLLKLARPQFNRLAQTLTAQGLVEREREPAPPSGLARSRQYIYGLSASGRTRTQKLLGRTPQAAFSKGRLRATLFVTHDLLVTEAALRLNLTLPARLADWFTGADCRDDFKSPQGRGAVEPDLVFLVNSADGPGCGWVEVETGTGGRKSVVDKTGAMDHYYASGAFRRKWGTERLTIVWIGDREGHARQLRDWVGPCRPRLMHMFTSWEWVHALGIDGPIWLRLNGGETRFPLLSGPTGPGGRKDTS